ncbi:MAG: RluA family pseudouridine synthase [Puniceicoccales bacterium]
MPIKPDPRAVQADAPEISENEFIGSILFENERVLAVDKPGWLVCHPSKKGPGSSLVGAAKRYLQQERLHLVSRLDRETSGIVVFAKDRGAARTIQMGVEARRVSKSYDAVLEGSLTETITVDRRIVSDKTSEVRVKMRALPTERDENIRTHFFPIRTVGPYTHCRVVTDGGRKHQIRVHAASMGHPLVGDKLYGPDETLYLEFCREGWTDRLTSALSFHRQALHCGDWSMENDLELPALTAPLPRELAELVEIH